LNFKKEIATCQVVIVPRGSDNDTCHLCHFHFLNLVPLF